MYLAGDVGTLIELGMGTGEVDGTTITEVRLFALPPTGGSKIELTISVDSQDEDSVSISHTTDGSLNKPGCWILRAFFYVDSELVLSSLEKPFEVSPRRVGPPTT